MAAGSELVCVDRVAGASTETGLLDDGGAKEFTDASSAFDGVALVSFGRKAK